ncbi:amidohydrolase [Sulfitobacter sp. G21635-S1]|uniref:amidohydrolase n=1 Tax=Sulfitobacter sp. G21635-S1 TaxID=3014043 RepID=UPI0022AFFAF5|nr:amidohydrolase [Sulfitobacter sp. G21635-S1]MCZ4256656.1 amidohydrolase [Sulfitobacter sp. G21635-S1]
MKADIVVLEGRVLTMDRDHPRAEAVAVSDGKIIAVGSNTEIEILIGPETKVISARGGTVLPGFIESHMHLFGGASQLSYLDLTGLFGFENVAEAVRAYAAANPDARLLTGKMASYTMLGEGTRLDRHHLDRILPDRPLAFVSFDNHTMWGNTLALEKAGLLQGLEVSPGNAVVMGDDGLANGELNEAEAYNPLLRFGGLDRGMLGMTTGGEPDPKPTKDEFASDVRMVKDALKWCAQHGITSIHNMDGNFYTFEILEKIQRDGDLLCRVKVPFHYKNFMKLDDLEKASTMTARYDTEWLSSGLVKMFYDGVLDGHTAYMLDGYGDQPDFQGEPLFTQEQFNEVAIEADRRGLQIAVHAIGSGAVRSVLNGYEAAADANGTRDSRHRLEHIEVIDPDDLPRIAGLGAIASVQPPHPPGMMGTPLEPTLTVVGQERLPYFYAFRAFKESGAHVVFASDWPVADLNVMRGVHAAMTREPYLPHLPDQRFTLHEALYSYTVEGAYAEHAEDIKGRLQVGMLADIVVLSADIEAVPTDDIPQMTPIATICGGKVTYEAAQ